MEIFRIIYRNIFVETILLAIIFLQVFSGIKLVIQAKKTATTLYNKLHIYSGIYLAFFLLVHVSAVLSARIIFHIDTNSYFGAATLNSFPSVIVFVPYYFLAIVAFFTHVACIHYKKTKSKIQMKIIIALGLLYALYLIFALTNHFHGYKIPNEYLKMIKAMSF